MSGSQGGAEAAKRMAERAARVRDHGPALKVFGEVLIKATADAFQASRGVDGMAWPPLAASTIIARHLRRAGGRPKGFSKKSLLGGKTGRQRRLARDLAALEGKKMRRGGRLTDAAKLTRMEAVISQAGITTLVDTGRLKNSQRATMRGRNTLVWSAVGYGAPHITGGKRSGAALMGGAGLGFPPMRNFSCFEGTGADARLKRGFLIRLCSMVTRYIETGVVA